MRAIIGVLALLTFVGCLNFDKLLSDCDAGAGPCAAASGGGSGGGGGSSDGGGVGGGGAAGGGGGGDDGGNDGGVDGGPTDAGSAVPECAADEGATLQSPDGSISFCFNGFAWENPRPHGTHLNAVWGRNENDVWAAGAGGMLMHWDGGSWASYQGTIPPQFSGERLGDITAIAGNATGAWLAGHSVMPHSLQAGAWGLLNVGASVRWSIDAMGGPVAVSTTGQVYGLPSFGPLLTGPTGSQSPDFVRAVAVRDDGFCAYSGLFNSTTRSIHRVWNCDGGVLHTFDAGATDAVAGTLWFRDQLLNAASTDRDNRRVSVWVLDGGSVTERWGLPNQDQTWTAVSVPTFATEGFLVGTQGFIGETANGTEYVLGLMHPHDLLAVQSFSGGSWAVGRNGALFHEQPANAWTWQQRGVSDSYFGLWVAEDGGVWFCGEGGRITDRATGATTRVSPNTLRALHGFSDGGWLVVTDDGDVWRNGPGSGVELYPGPPTNALTDLYVDDTETWAVGINTVLRRQADAGWFREVPPGGGQEWWKIARAGSRMFVAGSQGLVGVYTLDGGWKDPAIETGAGTNYGVWTIDAQAGTAWVVGGGPSIYYLDASGAGSIVPSTFDFSGLTGSLFDVWGSSPNDVWAVGDDGLALHFDGNVWTLQETGTRSKLERVRSRPLPGGGRELIIVGEFGTVIRKRY